MFLQASVILFTGGGGIPAYLAGGIQACQDQTQSGALRGLARGGSPGRHRGVSKPTLGGGGLQAHTWWFSRLTPGGSPGSHLWGLQAHTQGVSRPTPRGCIPTCTEADLSS